MPGFGGPHSFRPECWAQLGHFRILPRPLPEANKPSGEEGIQSFETKKFRHAQFPTRWTRKAVHRPQEELYPEALPQMSYQGTFLT